MSPQSPPFFRQRDRTTRFIVTGATGFIGRRLIDRLLDEGHTVTAMLHKSEPKEPLDPRVKTFRADVTQPETLEGKFADCDVVMHLAGCTIARSKTEFDFVNHMGTLNVARECARQTAPPRFMFVSSLAAAGPSQPGQPHVESGPTQPVSDYGRSKRDAERALLAMSQEIPLLIARPACVFGDTDPYLLNLFKAAKLGLVLLAGPGNHRYSFIHVDDLTRALIHMVECSSVQSSSRPHVEHGLFKRERDRSETHAVSSDATGNSAYGGANSWCAETVSQGTKSNSANHAAISRGDSKPTLAYMAHSSPLTLREFAGLVAESVGTRKVRQIRLPSVFCWMLAAINSQASRLLR
ncbi:MAG: NAD-dependent epimerase/dehydratase family protein, partial [Rubripirellula sp.]